MSITHLRLQQRVYAGFGVLVVLSTFVTAFALWRLSEVRTNVESLARNSANALRAEQASELVSRLRISRLLFTERGDENGAKDFKAILAQAQAVLAEMDVVAPERQAMVVQVQKGLSEHGKAFGDIEATQRTLAEHRGNSFKGGDLLTQETDKLMAVLHGSHDLAVLQAGEAAEKSILLVRVANWRFMATRDPAGVATFKTNFEKAQLALTGLEKASGGTVHAQLQPVVASLQAYADNFETTSHDLLAADAEFSTMRAQASGLSDLLSQLETGVVGQFQLVQQDNFATIATALTVQSIIAVIQLLAGIGLAYLIGRAIVGPVLGMTKAMRQLSAGNFDTPIPCQGQADEMGEMAGAVTIFRTTGIEKMRVDADVLRVTAARTRRQEEIDQLVGLFGRSLGSVFTSVSTVSAEMANTSASLGKSADTAGNQAGHVANEVDLASQTVQTVAAAAQELTASIEEIGRQAEVSSQMSSDAMAKTQVVVSAFTDLRAAADQIGTVVALINNIAGQTNLLALNATIEAARAGDAGKGFAVVAGEVKSLADQTARATGDIGSQIAAIQSATVRTADAIQSITESVRSIHGVGSAIASAVTQQSAATQEIARSVEQVSNSTTSITESMKRVNDAIQGNRTNSMEVSKTSLSLSGEAQNLSIEVKDFLAALQSLSEDQTLAALKVDRAATVRHGSTEVAGQVSKLSIGSAVFSGRISVSPGTKVELKVDGIDRLLQARYVEPTAGGYFLQLALNHECLAYMGQALTRLSV